MMKNKLRGKTWYSNAIALCAAVIVYVLLIRWGSIWNAVRTFFQFFNPVIVACVLAYVFSPLSRLYNRALIRLVRREKLSAGLADFLTIITVLVFVAFLLIVVLPQPIESLTEIARNLDNYVAQLEKLLEGWGVTGIGGLDLQSFVASSESVLEVIADYAAEHITILLNTSANAGIQFLQLVISFILSIYLLAGRGALKTGVQRLLRALLGKERYKGAAVYLHRCDSILTRYIVFNLLDGLIIGIANAIFMLIAGMPYTGLVSFVCAITNLVPTFGPVVGAIIGVLILILVKPWYALAFLIFTLVIQTIDAYILKPKLFGNSLGIPAVWILIGIIVGGRMFGLWGILMAIPAVAIIDFSYREYFLPWLETRHARARTPQQELPKDPQKDPQNKPQDDPA